MSGQPGKNVIVAYKAESGFGVAATGGSGEAFRIQSGAGGLTMGRALIEDPEVRKDGQRSMARLGTKEVTGTYPGTLSVGTFNTLMASLFRRLIALKAVGQRPTAALIGETYRPELLAPAQVA